jgi:formylglycine-generating enzyme required for sulfatase activity
VEYAGVAPVAVFESDRSTYACWDMAGNVMEWTRSVFTAPYDRRSAETGIGDVWFGASLAVRGGTFEQERVSLDLRRPMAFDAAGPALGFRCVLPFPPDNAAVDAALDRLGF